MEDIMNKGRFEIMF